MQRRLMAALIVLCCFFSAAVLGWYNELRHQSHTVIADMTAYFLELTGGPNIIFNPRRFGPGPGRIPRSNADIMSSMCVFDVSDGPVIISGLPWKRYWSVALYSANGDNFYTLSHDDHNTSEPFNVVITSKQNRVPGSVIAPEDRGVMILRRFVPLADEASDARTNQDSTTCQSAHSL